MLVVVFLSSLALFVLVTAVLRWRNGRFTASTSSWNKPIRQDAKPEPQNPLAAYADGERATLVQFSSAFCAPCRATRRTLADIAGTVPGVAHVEIDAEAHLELVRALKIMRTPTTIVVDARAREVARASGAPTKEQVLNALSRAL